MSKRSVTPDVIGDAVSLREAGYTVLAISQRLGVSVRTLERHFAAHGARKGALKQEVIDNARQQLLQRVISREVIQEEAAKLVADDLAHARHLRNVMVNASEHLTATTLQEAAVVMRAAAAYSTALKNTSDTLRHVMGLDKPSDPTEHELPTLVIEELTPEEVAAIRAVQNQEEDDMAAVGADAVDANPVVVDEDIVAE